MPKIDDIRSTEKLLDLIRASDHEKTENNPHSSQFQTAKAKKPGLFRPLSFSKKATVGVDIGHTYIKMAKIQHFGEKKFELVDYLDIPLNRNFSASDPEILKILKENLDSFCGSPANQNIWSAIPSAKVETSCIRIPKLPRKQIRNAIYWTFTKRISYNAQEEILDYEILGDISEGGIKKTEVTTFKAPKDEIQSLKNAFQEIGYPLKGITIVPFAIQNLFRTQVIDQQDLDVCCLFVGRDWSRIAIYNQNNLALSRGIKAGMRSMVEAIHVAMQHQDAWEEQTAQQWRKQPPDGQSDYIEPDAQKLFFDFIRGRTGDQQQPLPAGQASSNEVFQWIQPALERLVRQVERTIEHYVSNFHRQSVRKIYISGQVTANPAVVNYIGQQLDLPIVAMNPFSTESFVRQVRVPGESWEKEAYVPAIGLALSSNSLTPNCLYTHEDKDAAEDMRRNNMRVLSLCLLCLLVLIGMFTWQERQLEAKRLKLDKLNLQMATYHPPADKNLLLALYAKTNNRQQALQSIVQRYAPLAIIQELSQITPSNIRLLNVDTAFATVDPAKTKEIPGSLSVEGLIFSDSSDFETILSSYLFALSNSPIFRKPSVQSKRVEYFDMQEVLRFSLKIDII